MPNEHKRGDDFGMYYNHSSGKRHPKELRVESWDDMGPSDSSHSFVIEFD
ncbi:hypothetical protein [Rhizobium sp. R339]|nr:hypothetical protein [Rhizobium sp. R339]